MKREYGVRLSVPPPKTQAHDPSKRWLLRRYVYPPCVPSSTLHFVCAAFLLQCCSLPHRLFLLLSDPNERAHFWLPDSEVTTSHQLLESATADRMYIDQGEIVRVRVEVDEFYDDEPGPPKAAEGVVIKREARRAPYTIIVSFETMSG